MPTEEETRAEAARLAGWNPDDGPASFRHTLPPENDPELGHNGVPAPKPGDPDYTGGAS